MVKRFAFGANWSRYVRYAASDESLRAAETSLLHVLPADAYRGRDFVDAGCGTGLFSLAALRLGCARVDGFDADPRSVEAVGLLRRKLSHLVPDGAAWTVRCADLLDPGALSGDIVYCWGVVHHTGRMWDAIASAASIVAPGGRLILGVYNHAPNSAFWWRVKKLYVERPLFRSWLIVLHAVFIAVAAAARGRRVALRRDRGMHALVDLVDWLGGFPYEYACFDDVARFVERLGLTLEREVPRRPCGRGARPGLFGALRTANTGLNEFLFRRPA